MPKTLLLCFIHGFKGDEETFFDFPSNLKEAISSQNSSLEIQTRVYPKYETRGDLAACVETFKEWLQDQVVTIETSNANKNAISAPDVGVILVAHSMGGFVAADTLFSVLDNGPVSPDSSKKLMFPLIHGVLLFDSPLNGLARPMFAYGAFAQYQNLSGVLNIISTVSSSIPMIGTAAAPSAASASTVAASAGGAMVASQASSWRRWQALASRTGAYGAIMAGGVAAYVHREQIYNSLAHLSMPTRESIAGIKYKENLSQGLTYVSRDAIGEGFTWMASHLKFVGALMKTGQLTSRLGRLEGLEGVGVVNLYTSLGENGVWNGGYFVPKRTFCAVPSAGGKEKGEKGEKEEKEEKMWREIPNPKAENEIYAHCSMFKKEKNAGYDYMLDEAKGLVCEWIKNEKGEVKDEYTPSREVLHRSMSEHKAWDDDGKVLESVPEKQAVESVNNEEAIQDDEKTEDEKQLQAILKCEDMPLPEGGDEEIMEALDVPLPVDEDVDASTHVLGLSEIEGEASKVPQPEDHSAGVIPEAGKGTAKEEKAQSSGWFKNPVPLLYGKKQEAKIDSQQAEPKGEQAQSSGWFKNPVPMLYGSRGKAVELTEQSDTMKESGIKDTKIEDQAPEGDELKPSETDPNTDGIKNDALSEENPNKEQPAEKSTVEGKPAEDRAVEEESVEKKAVEEKAKSTGWFKNPIPSLYGAKKEISK